MEATFVITVYVVFETMLHTVFPPRTYQPKMTPAEIMTVAVVAARSFQNNLERALLILRDTGYLPAARCLSVSRFNRQLHRYADELDFCLQTLMTVACEGEAFMLDSLPAPVCKRVRARRCRKVRGRLSGGSCAAKREKFFGWRVHLMCTPDGLPVAFPLLPAALHDLTPLYELTVELPEGACLYGDKAWNSGPDEAALALEGLRVIPIRKKNMRPHAWLDDLHLRLYRHGIETVKSHLESMGLERLRARTNAGFVLKVQSSLLALYHTQLIATTN